MANKGQMLVIWHPYPRDGECRLSTVDKGTLMSFGRKIINRRTKVAA